MSNAEAMEWFDYLGRRGTLNLGLRMEVGFANIALLICTAAKITKDGGQAFKMEDFMPHIDRKNGTAGELTIENAMAALGMK